MMKMPLDLSFALFCAIFLTFVMPARASVIVIGNSAVSPLYNTTPNSSTMSYNNDGDFLVVSVLAQANGTAGAAPNVTFNGKSFGALSEFHSSITDDYAQASNDSYAYVGFLKNAEVGTFDLVVDYAPGNGPIVFNDGGWQVSVLSLSNVNEIDPISGISWVDTGTGASTDTTILSDNPGEIKDGGLLYIASARSGTSASDPLFDPATGGLTTINFESLDTLDGDPTNGRFGTYYKFLDAGDLSGANNDQVFLTTSGGGRESAFAFVINDINSGNQIPEPSSVVLTALGCLVLRMVNRNRRKSA